MSEAPPKGEGPTPAAAAAAAASAPEYPLEHPARPDDRDRGRVIVSYEGYRFPIWVLLVWVSFIVFALAYVASYVLPTIKGS
jgi:hypothetical protein